MPAVPVIVTASSRPGSCSSSGASSGSSSGSGGSGASSRSSSRLRPPPAFTVLPEAGCCCCADAADSDPLAWLPVNRVRYCDDCDSAPRGEEPLDPAGRRFRASRPDQQSVTAANAHVVRRKLMRLQQRPAPGRVKVNNLRAAPAQQPAAKRARREPGGGGGPLAYSAAIGKALPAHDKNLLPAAGRCSYHKNCLAPATPPMAAPLLKPPPARRRSSPGSDDSLGRFAKNNNYNNYNNNNNEDKLNLKNKQLERQNRLNNGGRAPAPAPAAAAAGPRPLFVTTVRSGEFLDPPPELALLLGLRPGPGTGTLSASSPECASSRDSHRQQVLLYSFSSQPRVLHQHHHRSRCDAAKAAGRGPAPAPPAAPPAAPPPAPHARVRRSTAPPKPSGSDGPPPYGNLMFDRRVVRGSTYAQHPVPQPKWNPNFGYARILSQTDCESQAARQLEARRRALARRRAQGQQSRFARYRLGTPPPVPGRRHEPVQTEKYLEELPVKAGPTEQRLPQLWERPPEADVGCQTDLFLDRPPSPVFVPAKTGQDAATQIYPGDLFDFDVEVVPILEVLVGKTVQQAMLEVLEEEELAALREQQRRFLESRAAEEAERRRLEEQERRLREEKERRLREFTDAAELAKDTEARVAAAVLTQGYLADLLPSVLEGLREAGYLLDDIREDVRANFMPWLMREVQQEMNNMVASRDILMELVREILEARADAYRTMGEAEAARLHLDSDEEAGAGELSESDESELRAQTGSMVAGLADTFVDTAMDHILFGDEAEGEGQQKQQQPPQPEGGAEPRP